MTAREVWTALAAGAFGFVTVIALTALLMHFA